MTNEEYKSINRNITPITGKEPTLAQILKEGEELLKADELKAKKIAKSPVKPKVVVVDESNPYRKAKNQILSKWNSDPGLKWKAKEIEDMDAGKYPKDRHYDDFVKLVVELGDKL